jgi:hypothetical protein
VTSTLPSRFALAAFAVLWTGSGTHAAEPQLPDLGSEAPAKVERPARNYLLPAAEIAGFDFLLNRYNRWLRHDGQYSVDAFTVNRNLRSRWVVDNDPFKVNQFLHPYQGSMYHGFARSAGFSFWESMGYTFLGSAGWEIAGENTPPSRNDQIASGIAGSFLGESLYRMSNLVLERGEPGSWLREASAAAVAPSAAFNRFAFGERFRALLDSNNPAYYSRVQVGTSATTQNVAGNSSAGKGGQVLADFSMDYGLPGKPGYRYLRPFDYFSFQAVGSSANGVESLTTRGLLLGRPYELGDRYRGIWGLYGSYDYLAPQLFRVSSTALSMGSTAQYRLSDALVLQGTALAGVGYAGVSTLHSIDPLDYHYGVAPQALLALRLIYKDRVSLDVTGREYLVSKVAGASNGGHDNIARADISLTFRVYKQHAVAIKYQWSRRDATFPTLGDLTQARGTLGIYYTLLGQDRFGTVDWD